VKADWSRRRRALYAALAMVLPVAVGYFYLEARGALLNTNASYDAYKMLSVFIPGVLCGCCYWIRLEPGPGAGRRWVARLVVVGMTVGNVIVAGRFMSRMGNPPLLVDQDLAALQSVESHPEVTSINMKIPDFWTRLWANAMLLHKPQYFLTHTYEGRRNTALKGQWDLTDGVVAVTAPPEAGTLRIGNSFLLQDRRSPYFVEIKLGDGWYPEERILRASRRWNWSKGDATVQIDNPQASARTITLTFKVRSVEKRDLQVWQDGHLRGTIPVTEDLSQGTVSGLAVPPGKTVLTLRSSQPPTPGNARDGRPLEFALYSLDVDVQRIQKPK
jgi:hypothetical protein